MLKIFQRKSSSDPAENLKKVLGDRELPTFPAVVTRALQSLRNPDTDLTEAGDLIEADPGLSVRVLRTVNSAACSLRHEIRSIHHALSLLGRNQVESILIGAAVRDALPNKPAMGFEAKRFWGTSAVRAVVAGHLAELIDPSRRSECFTASLLQDLAVPLLAQEREQDYGPILVRCHDQGEPLHEMEQETFGWDHAQVATWVCKGWQFPKVLTDAIGCHHGTGEEGMEDLPAVRYVARIPETHPEEARDALIELMHADLGLATDAIAEMLDRSEAEGADLARLFT